MHWASVQSVASSNVIRMSINFDRSFSLHGSWISQLITAHCKRCSRHYVLSINLASNISNAILNFWNHRHIYLIIFQWSAVNIKESAFNKFAQLKWVNIVRFATSALTRPKTLCFPIQINCSDQITKCRWLTTLTAIDLIYRFSRAK